MSEVIYHIICEEANAQQVSFSQFVRESSLSVAIYRRGVRGAEPGKTIIETIEEIRNQLGT